MAVKVKPVAGGEFVEVHVEKGTEVYDPESGLLFEVGSADVEELKDAIADAVKAGKKIKE